MASRTLKASQGGRGASRGIAKQQKSGLDDEQMEELKEAFNLFDTEGKNVIDVRELKAAFRALGFQVKKAEIRQMFIDMDKDLGSANVTLDEFIDMVSPRMLNRDSREEIMKVFSLFDDDNSGAISFKNLKRVAMELGENLTDEELQEMIDEADRDGDGLINEEEFYRVMRKRENPLDEIDSDDDF
jgi:centrin-1